MRLVSLRTRLMVILLLLLLLLIIGLPSLSTAQTTFNQIISFGDSLSDPGNAFVLTGEQTTPPYDTLDSLRIPSAPYAKGGHHFSNGSTWIEQFATSAGLPGDANSAFRGAGTNYAVGGARAYDAPDTINLFYQVATFLVDFDGDAPEDALYTIEFGGNDIRDALSEEDPSIIIAAALNSISDNINDLYKSGARKFLVWNAPDVGLTPALLFLGPVASGYATFLTDKFNAGLNTVLVGLAKLPGIEIQLFDAYGIMHNIVGSPEAYGLDNNSDTCVQPELPPFKCKEPDEYLFWDGIHPTKAVHAILAEYASQLLMEP